MAKAPAAPVRSTEVVPFRLIHTECCGTLLCWVNPRLPSFCPECGKPCYPDVRGWIVSEDQRGILKLRITPVPKEAPSQRKWPYGNQ